MLNMQNVKHIEITEGDVRTIHDKDNRLIWGRLAYDTKYVGDTFQQTYSGKNLFSSGFSTSFSANETNTFTMVKPSVRTTNFVFPTQLPAGTYTFSWSISGDSTNTGLAFYDENNTRISSTVNATTQDSLTFTTTSPIHHVYVYINNDLPDGVASTFTKVQLETGSQPTSYEPYTNGPSPNPDYPQPIQVVTGEQTVTVTGKNLLDSLHGFADKYINDSGGESNGGGNNALFGYIAVKPEIAYTLSQKSDSLRLRNYGFAYYDASKTFLSRATYNLQTAQTITTPSNCSFIRIWVANSQTGVSQAIIEQSQLQFEQGSATAYEPYQGQSYTIDLGSIELCKIGNYQDYIYKSGDDWYVHKETSKASYSSHSGWTMGSKYGDYQGVYSTIPSMVAGRNTPIFTNYFRQVEYTSTPSEECTMVNANASVSTVIFYSKILQTSADLDTYFADEPMTLYIPLKTATDTKITDATLISQLDALHEWVTRYGYNATVTGNLPIIISQTTLN